MTSPFVIYQPEDERRTLKTRWLCQARDALGDQWPAGLINAWGDLSRASRWALLQHYIEDHPGEVDCQQYADVLRASVATLGPAETKISAMTGRGYKAKAWYEWFEVRPDWILHDFEMWAITLDLELPAIAPHSPYPVAELPRVDPETERPVHRLGPAEGE